MTDNNKKQPGGRVYLADNTLVYTDSMKHAQGEAWQSPYDGSLWIVTEEPIKVSSGYGIEWGHQLREATTEEVTQFEADQAAWEAKSKERRLDDLLDLFPDF